MAFTVPSNRRRWWKESSIYQIYPSSFKDSNADGIGDIPGIISKLDYLHDLGVDIIWVSPVYKSPDKDMGYDISDYRAIDPKYGNMHDLEQLVDGLHARGMKLVMDLVVNHTSDQHEWFQDSKNSRRSERRNWYVWRDPKFDDQGNRMPPNNWQAVFGGSAWEWDQTTEQYYLHCFLKEQPDLNWECEEVRKEVFEMMRFWLDKKVDGFRMDVIELISKASGFPDAPVIIPGRFLQPAEKLFSNGPRLHEFLRGIRAQVLSRYDVMTVGETPWMTEPEDALKVIGADRGELDMLFQFDMITMDFGNNGRYSWPKSQWDLRTLKGIMEKWQTFMIENDGWNSVCLESHDQPRCVSRFVDRKITDDDPVMRARVAKMLATLEAGQSGTIYIYQGQELGMKNIPYDWPVEEYLDCETQNAYKNAQESGDRETMEDFLRAMHLKARDHARTPVQWDSTPHGGFTAGKPWMRVNEDYHSWNAALQTCDGSSVFSFWKRVLQVRKQHKDVLIYGDFEMLAKEDKEVLVYKRMYGKQQALVVVNFTEETLEWTPPPERKEVIALVREDCRKLGNYEELEMEAGKMVLRPFEAAMFIG